MARNCSKDLTFSKTDIEQGFEPAGPIDRRVGNAA